MRINIVSVVDTRYGHSEESVNNLINYLKLSMLDCSNICISVYLYICDCVLVLLVTDWLMETVDMFPS